MPEIRNIETTPGFTLESPHFITKFLAGFEKGVSSKFLEYETDWLEVMSIMLETLEIFPNSVETIEEVLAKAIDDWIIINAFTFNIKTTVKMEEKVCFPPPFGAQKNMKITFSDKFQTEAHFYIKKKSSLKSLKELGAAAVVEDMKREIDIAKLEIPVTLFPDVLKAFRNDFSVKYHKENINCCFNHKAKEGNIDRSEPCNLSKRSREADGKKNQKSKKRKLDNSVNTKQKIKVPCSGCGKLFIRISAHKCKVVAVTR